MENKKLNRQSTRLSLKAFVRIAACGIACIVVLVVLLNFISYAKYKYVSGCRINPSITVWAADSGNIVRVDRDVMDLYSCVPSGHPEDGYVQWMATIPGEDAVVGFAINSPEAGPEYYFVIWLQKEDSYAERLNLSEKQFCDWMKMKFGKSCSVLEKTWVP